MPEPTIPASLLTYLFRLSCLRLTCLLACVDGGMILRLTVATGLLRRAGQDSGVDAFINVAHFDQVHSPSRSGHFVSRISGAEPEPSIYGRLKNAVQSCAEGSTPASNSRAKSDSTVPSGPHPQVKAHGVCPLSKTVIPANASGLPIMYS